MKKYLFEKEIRNFGIKRSGNTATVSFILGHYKPSEIVYLHNTDFSFRPRNRRISPFEFFNAVSSRGVRGVKCYLNTTEYNYPLSSHFEVISERMGDRNYSYNVDRGWYSWQFGFEKKNFSRDKYNILIIRSPHNNLASIMGILQRGKGFEKHIASSFTEAWLMYAREILGETKYFKNKVICNFDEWFSSEDYRRNLSDQLGLEYSDKGVNSVIRRVGSSFDGHKYRKNAQKMKVLDRWEHFKDDNDYLDKLRNEELIEKTKLLFDVDLREILDV